MRCAWILILLCGLATAEEPSVSALAKTIRFHPTGEPAAIGLRMLSRKDVPGWKVLASLCVEYAKSHADVALLAAAALAEGPETERLAIAAATYSRARDDRVRAKLAYALAFGYETHRTLLLGHMRKNRPGAADVLTVLAPSVLPEAELRRYLSIPDLAPIAYDALLRRGLTVRPKELLVWARAIARTCLEPTACRAWADKTPDFTILTAVALVIADQDDDVRDGSHCLLMTMSGKKLPPDPDLWRSWIAARADRYEKPAPLSKGEMAAAVVRAARFLKLDLLDDGRTLWVRDSHAHHQIGSTALSVIALRAAGYPIKHPAIQKALQSTMLLFDRVGRPALRPTNRDRETYVLAMLALALCELDTKRHRVPLEALRQRLVQGMLEHGAWGYQCRTPTDKGKPGRSDNSCTQYAVLALRELHRRGFAVPKDTWQNVAAYFRKSQRGDGGWNYHHGHAGNLISMTSAGVSSLTICLEGMHGRQAGDAIRKDAAIQRGLSELGRRLMIDGFADSSTYAYYGVERACILGGADQFAAKHRTYDWYKRGARRLVSSQSADGAMHARGSNYYGSSIDSAYAILFLTRATQTIGGNKPTVVRVKLDAKHDKPEPPRPVDKEMPLPPVPPKLELERVRYPTRSGEATIAGQVARDGVTLHVDGVVLKPDARGRFFWPVTITSARTISFAVRDAAGLETKRSVRVEFDRTAPKVRLLGPPERHVGKQILVFRSDEPLRALRVAGHVYPADGRVVRAAVKIREGARAFSWTGTDLAGNEGRGERKLGAFNRHLVLDGKSTLRIDGRPYPQTFTLECWARSTAPPRGCLVACTEGSGFGIAWGSKRFPFPNGFVRVGRDYVYQGINRPLKKDAWAHFAFVFDGKKARFFANGKLHSEADAPGPRVMSGRPLYIGAEPNQHGHPHDFFTGAIDEVRFSNGVRYTSDFKPARNFMRDSHTLGLYHFDRDTLAAGLALDDSRFLLHARVIGTPKIEGASPRGDALEDARAELRKEVAPAHAVALSDQQRNAQNGAARTAAQKHLGLVAVTIRVVSPTGIPYGGLAVRALHDALDIAADVATTDANGDAIIRLPRGPWRVDLATPVPQAGRVIFARVPVAVRGPARHEVVLDATRTVQFRTADGDRRAAHTIFLTWADQSFAKRVVAHEGQLEIMTAGKNTIWLQAVRRPDERGGYIIRRPIGLGNTTIETEPKDATEHVFRSGGRVINARYTSSDGVPLDLSFKTKKTRTMRIAGPLGDVVLHVASESGGRKYGFYPRPYPVDGKQVVFTGAPRFDIGVGSCQNWRPQYNERKNSVSFRVFLTTKSGLMLKPDAPYTVAWQQMFEGKVRFEGETEPAAPVITAPIARKQFGNLRYKIHVRGPGFNGRVEVAAYDQIAEVRYGKVRTWCFPPVAPNARHWAACVDRAIRAYELTTPRHRNLVDIERSIHMPLPIIGMGGPRGNNGWMWLPEPSLYGFWGTYYWTGLLSHELGHVFEFWHHNPFVTKLMVQAGRRAGRKLQSIRLGMSRVPEGNRYLPLLEAITNGDLEFKTRFEDEDDKITIVNDAAGDGVFVPNLEITGEDGFLTWFSRSRFGEEANTKRAQFAGAWSWVLTVAGFSDSEIQFAILSRAAGTNLAWLARMRGIVVHDYRLDAALGILEKGPILDGKQRHALTHKWRTRRFTEDLAQEEKDMLGELGDRMERVRALLSLARESLLRGNDSEAERVILSAMEDARRGGATMLDTAAIEAAPYWAGR